MFKTVTQYLTLKDITILKQQKVHSKCSSDAVMQ